MVLYFSIVTPAVIEGGYAAAMTPDTWDIFVYGTLRRGFCNHHYLARAEFLGQAFTRDGFAMYVQAGIPSLVRHQPGEVTHGELYRVDAATLADLDALEEHPRVYRRELAPVVLAPDGREGAAWIYFARQIRGRRVATGDFRRVAGPGALLSSS